MGLCGGEIIRSANSSLRPNGEWGPATAVTAPGAVPQPTSTATPTRISANRTAWIVDVSHRSADPNRSGVLMPFPGSALYPRSTLLPGTYIDGAGSLAGRGRLLRPRPATSSAAAALAGAGTLTVARDQAEGRRNLPQRRRNPHKRPGVRGRWGHISFGHREFVGCPQPDPARRCLAHRDRDAHSGRVLHPARRRRLTGGCRRSHRRG